MLKKKMSTRKIVLKNAVYNLATNILNKIFVLAFSVGIARILQPDLFGLYGIVLSVVSILLAFAEAGINTTLFRYIASSKDKKKASACFWYLFKIKIILTLSISFLLIVSAKPLAIFVFHKPELFFPFIVAAFYLAALSFTEFFATLFGAFNEFKFYPVKELIFQPLRLALVFSVLLLVSKTVNNIFYGLITAYAIILLWILYMAKKRYGFLFVKEKLLAAERKKILIFFGFMIIAGISTPIFNYIDATMLGIFLEAKYVGFYRAAQGIALAIAELVMINNVLFPIFSQLAHGKIGEAFKKSIRYSAILSFPVAFGLALTAAPFIKILYGSAYLPAAFPLYALSFLVIMQTVYIYPTLFIAREKPQLSAKILIFSAIVNIILNYIFIKFFLSFSQLYATLGSAIAVVLSNLFYFIMFAVTAKKEFGIGLEAKALFKPLFASIVMAAFLLAFNIYVGLEWPIAIVEIFLAAIVYFAVMLAIKGITKEDFQLFKLLKKDKEEKQEERQKENVINTIKKTKKTSIVK